MPPPPCLRESARADVLLGAGAGHADRDFHLVGHDQEPQAQVKLRDAVRVPPRRDQTQTKVLVGNRRVCCVPSATSSADHEPCCTRTLALSLVERTVAVRAAPTRLTDAARRARVLARVLAAGRSQYGGEGDTLRCQAIPQVASPTVASAKPHVSWCYRRASLAWVPTVSSSSSRAANWRATSLSNGPTPPPSAVAAPNARPPRPKGLFLFSFRRGPRGPRSRRVRVLRVPPRHRR